MNQFKRAQVIMLPTQLNTCNLVPIIKYINGKLQYLNMEFTNNSLIGQHLYIISDDEIKEGDWIIWNNKIVQAIDTAYHTAKKIIATTDTSLKILDERKSIDIPNVGGGLYFIKLPQPSQQFIEKYIESYNKGEVITDVLVEYVKYTWEWDYKLKVTPKDNTITIKKIKDVFTLEDMKSAFDAGMNCPIAGATFEEWIKQNL